MHEERLPLKMPQHHPLPWFLLGPCKHGAHSGTEGDLAQLQSMLDMFGSILMRGEIRGTCDMLWGGAS